MSLRPAHRLIVRVAVVVAVIVAAKAAVRALGWEVVSVNPMFTGVVAANIFLMGFLLSGVLSDYKEAEKLPGELAACLENMAQEIVGIGLGPNKPDVAPALRSVDRLGREIRRWFLHKTEMPSVVERLDNLTVKLAAVEPTAQVSYIVRVKQEQSNLRRTMLRIETIRDTSFVSAGYVLVDLVTALMCLGLVLMSMDPFYEALIITGAISFVLVFLRQLIRDLDNPFDFTDRASGADVSLKPFLLALDRLDAVADRARRRRGEVAAEDGARPKGRPDRRSDPRPFDVSFDGERQSLGSRP